MFVYKRGLSKDVCECLCKRREPWGVLVFVFYECLSYHIHSTRHVCMFTPVNWWSSLSTYMRSLQICTFEDSKILPSAFNISRVHGQNYLHFRQNSIKFFYYNIADLFSYRAHINEHNCQAWSKSEVHKKMIGSLILNKIFKLLFWK